LTFDLMCMSTFLMRIYELFLAKLFYSSNKVLSLLNRMLSHTTHKHGLSGTYCFVFVKEKYDPFIFWFSCLLCTFWGLLFWELIFLTHKLLMHFSCVQYGYWIILWVGEFFFFQNIQFCISCVLLFMVVHFIHAAFCDLLMIMAKIRV
jgi:hypothetical protein